MNLNVNISPQDEQLLNDILDNGINEITKSIKPIKDPKQPYKHYINDYKSSNISKSNKNLSESINFKDQNEKPAKSTALRSLLNEIKLDASSRSSSKTPPKMNIDSKTSNFNYSQSLNMNKLKDSLSQSKEANFTDVKSDIRNLQDKILGLEKKIFNKNSSSKSSEAVTILKNTIPEKDNENIHKEKPSNLKSSDSTVKLNHSLENFKGKVKSPSQTPNILHLKNKNALSKIEMQVQSTLFQNFIKKKSMDKPTINAKSLINNSSSRENSFLKNSKDQNQYNYRNTVKEWKDKYYRALKEHEISKGMMVKEKQKNCELIKINKNLERKSSMFDNLNYRLNKLIDDNEKLLNQYEQSELIRREQSKLIKTLQNEVSILRKYDGTTNNAFTNLDNTTEENFDSRKF